MKQRFLPKILFMLIPLVMIYLIVMTLLGIQKVNRCYNELQEARTGYTLAQRDLALFEEASEYLTEQARLYVVKGQISYLENYFEEAEGNRSREQALRQLEEGAGKDNQAYQYLYKSYVASNILMDQEIHALKLIASVNDVKDSVLPDTIKNYTFTEHEVFFGNSEKKLWATELLYGDKYLVQKENVEAKIKLASKYILSESADTETICNLHLQMAISELCFYCIAFVTFTVLVICILFYRDHKISKQRKDAQHETK